MRQFEPGDLVTTYAERQKVLFPFQQPRMATVIMHVLDGVMILWDFDDIPRVFPQSEVILVESEENEDSSSG